jgi:hypothetical protein
MMERASISHEERNAIILRRTLGAISWLYALWTGLFAAAAWGRTTAGPHDAKILAAHAVLLALAGLLLWKPRRGAILAALAASAGSLYFVVLDLRRHSGPSALVDGAYVVLAVLLLYNSRRQP